MTTKRILLSSLLLASQVGYAGMSNMKAPTDLPSAMVMPKGVRSLNLSVACGIAIYEAHKQINSQNSN